MIIIKLTGVQEAMDACDPKTVRLAARAAIDRATVSGRKIITDEVTYIWNVKQSDFKDRINITKPRIDDLKGVIAIGGKGMSLSYFGARQIMGATVRSRIGNQIKTGKVPEVC